MASLSLSTKYAWCVQQVVANFFSACETMFQRISLVLLSSILLAASYAASADPPARQTGRDKADKARTEAILQNDAWRNTLAGLDQWLSIQTMYSQKQIDDIRKQVLERVAKMSPDELEDFRQDLDARIAMLLSPEGRDILNWVAANLAAASPAYRKKMGLQYPDVAHLTAAQLREQLDLLEQKRAAAQGQSAAMERARQARIAGLQAEQRQEAQDRRDALNRAPATVSSPYRPSGMRQYPDVVSRPQYGWGFGFW